MANFIKSKLKAARDFIKTGDFPAAYAASQEVLSYESNNYNALVFSGRTLLELGQHDQSEQTYLKATEISPEQLLAWQGLSQLYERTSKSEKQYGILSRLVDNFATANDATKCAETLQKMVELRRQHGTRAQMIETLSLLLPSSPIYPIISTLPPPDLTQPGATTTFTTQLAVHNSLPLLEEITGLVEKEEDVRIAKEVHKRRMRLSSNRPENIRSDVGRDIWSSSNLPSLYEEIINHPHTSDELRYSTEAKLLRYKQQYLHSLPTGDAKDKLRVEIEEMARGVVVIGVPDELAWTMVMESTDAAQIEDYDIDMLRQFVRTFPDVSLSRVIIGFFQCRNIALTTEVEDEADTETSAPIDYEDAFQGALDGFNGAQDSIIAHWMMIELYAKDKDYPNTIKVAEAGLHRVLGLESLSGSVLPRVKIAFNSFIGTALVHLYPPKHHPRALGVLESVLSQDPDNVQALLARGYVLRYSANYDQARHLFARVAELISAEADHLLKLEAEEEVAWCASLSGDYSGAANGLQTVIDTLDLLDEHSERKAQAWWRLGKTLWDQNGDDHRKQAYRHFITALKRHSSFAPAFTSLGVYYSEFVEPPDPARASKCFQKAVELDPREGEAARRLASGFADEREWDLVEVVARRTIEGEGGAEDNMLAPGARNSAAASRYKPVNAWAWKAIGVVELNRNNFGPATISLQIALRADNNDFRTWSRLGEAYAKSGRPVAALKALTRAASISPDEWTCTYLIGIVHHQMGQYELAIAKFEQVLAHRPDEPGALLSLADGFLALGRLEFSTGFMTRSDSSFASSISACLRAIEGFPRFRRVAWKTAADGLFELSKTEKFANEEAVRQAVLALCNVLIYDGAGRPRERTVSGLGTYAMIASRLEENVSGRTILWLAVAAYQFRVELCDGDADTHAPALFDLAAVLHSAALKNPKGVQDVLLDQAAEALKLALKNEPSNELFWNALGTISFERDPKLAQHSYIRALELDPKSPAIWTNLGLFYLHHGDPELSNSALYHAQILDPEFSLAWVGQAFVAIVNGHVPEARSLLEHAISLSPPIPQAEYVYSHRTFKEFISARGPPPPVDHLFTPYFALGHYCGQMSQDPSGLHLFAIICERLGQTDLAIELLTQAIRILEAAYEETEDEKTERQFAIANVNLGRVRLGVANYAQAKEAFELVLGLTTENNDDLKGVDQDLSRLRAQAGFGVGLANFKLGELEDALASFETALEETPAELKDVQGHITILLAQTLWAIGSDEAQEAAKDQLLTCIGEDSQNLAAITTLAAMGIISQNDELTRATLSEILAMPLDRRRTLDPTRTVEQLLVLHHINSGRHEEASSILKTVVETEPFSEPARIDFAEHLLQTGRISAAKAVLDETWRLQPVNASQSSTHDLLRLSAVAQARAADIGEPGDKDEEDGSTVRPLAQGGATVVRAIMMAPWERKNWEALAYVRSVN